MGRVEEKEGRMEEKIASPACSYRREKEVAIGRSLLQKRVI